MLWPPRRKGRAIYSKAKQGGGATLEGVVTMEMEINMNVNYGWHDEAETESEAEIGGGDL